MNRTAWPRSLMLIGLLGMLAGALDPMEGAVIILPSSGLAALGGLLGKVRHHQWLYASFVLVTIGVAAMFVMSAYGGIGGMTLPSKWWGLLVLPYPLGWILGLISGIPDLVLSFTHNEAPPHAA